MTTQRLVLPRSGDVFDATVQENGAITETHSDTPHRLYHYGLYLATRPQDLGDYTLYAPIREARAQPIRDRITALLDQVSEAKADLLAVYKEESHD